MWGEYILASNKTTNLGIKLIQPTDKFIDVTFNNVIKDIDDKDITTLNSERERIELFKNKNNQLIIADDVTLRMANDTNVKLRASMPIVYGSQVANHIPLIGIKGMDYFLEYVDQYLQTLS